MKYILITMIFATPNAAFFVDGEHMGTVFSYSTLEACKKAAEYKKLDPRYPPEVAICKKWPL